MKFVTKQDLEKWAEMASEEYLANQVPLNESITKIAEDNSLNPEQIKRVCEFANIHTNLQLFEKVADKRFVFEQADSSLIMNSVKGEDESDKIASVIGLGFTGPVPNEISRHPVSVINSEMEKIASAQSEAEEDELELLDLYEKKMAAIKEMEMDKFSAEVQVKIAEEEIFEEMKNRVLGGEVSFREFCAAALDHAPTKEAQVTIKECLIKTAYRIAAHDGQEIFSNKVNKGEMSKLANAVPDDYIAKSFESPGAPVLVRNGNLNMYYVLDTLVKQKERSSAYDRPLLLLHDDVRYIKRKLTA